MALFYIFFLNLDVWFNSRQLILMASAFSLLQYALWVEVQEENLASHRSCSWKRETLLIALWDHCGYISLILCQNLTTRSFLNVSRNVDSETVSVRVSYSVTLNPLLSLVLWIHLLTQVWFYNFIHWSFGKDWFTELWRSSKHWQISFITQYPKRNHI